MSNHELQEQNELLQSEVAYYKELLSTLKEAAINAHIAGKPELYKDFAEFTHKAISLVELQVEKLRVGVEDEPYERDFTTERKEDEYEVSQRHS